jgi:hypothetical protein
VVVALVNCVGGILLALGKGSHVVALILFLNIFVVADREALVQILSGPEKSYCDDPYTFWFTSLLILFFGPGWIGVDSFQAKCQR